MNTLKGTTKPGGWNDFFKRQKRALRKLCKIVIESQFRHLKCGFLTWHMASEKFDCYPKQLFLNRLRYPSRRLMHRPNLKLNFKSCHTIWPQVKDYFANLHIFN